MKIKFNDKFLIGASLSGPQTEGFGNKANKSNWDIWFKEEPDKFYEQIGPELLWELGKNYKKIISYAKHMELKSLRTSIQWSRVISNFTTGKVDDDGIQFYKNYFEEMKKNGIEVHACLHHFDMPDELEKINGWQNEEVVEKFAEFAAVCFKEFGYIVDKWITLNEPLVIADSGYVYNYHKPLINDFQISMNVVKMLWYANARAIQEFRKSKLKTKIGICLNLTPAYPLDKNNLDDVKACENEHTITNNIFLIPSIKGEIDPKLISILKESEIEMVVSEKIKKTIKENTIDFLGVNYYAPVRLSSPKTKGKAKDRGHWFTQERHPKATFNDDRGWEIYGKGIYDIANWIKKDFNNIEWMVQENGMGITNEHLFVENEKVNDDYRIQFYEEHLYWLNKAISEGANCFGYHVWTLCDNWSWLNAFKNRYGLYRFDPIAKKFSIKHSGEWIKKFSNTNTLEIEDKKIIKWIEKVKTLDGDNYGK